jgi:hypothetical protein
MNMSLQIAFLHIGRLDVRHIAQERQPQVGFHVVLALDRVVEVIDKECQTKGNTQAPDHAQKDGEHFPGFHRIQGHLGGINHNNVVDLVAPRQPGLLHGGEDRSIERVILLRAPFQDVVIDAQIF